jgi:predicted O-linked N-acetylglucosamine transferase (SPINDLY family)
MQNKHDDLNKNLQLALSQMQSGHFNNSRKCALKVLRYQPKHDLANLVLAKLSLQQQDDEKTLSFLEVAVKSPAFSVASRNVFQELMQEMSRMNKFLLMQHTALLLIDRNANDGQAWYLLGASYLSQKKNSEALDALLKALQLLPGNLGVLTNLGGVLFLLGRVHEALDVLKKTLVPHPEVMMSHNNLGSVYRHLGRFEEGIEQFKLSLSYNPNYAEAHNNLGLTYAALLNYDAAICEYKLALESNPNLFLSYCNWAKALHNMGRLKEAMLCCEQALEIKNDSSEIWTCLGDVMRSANHIDQSIACYIKALDLWPNKSDHASRMMFTGLLFTLNYHPDLDAETVYDAYRDYEARFCLNLKPVSIQYGNVIDVKKKLKVGYVTQSFYNQACVFFLLPLLENHDKAEVEVFAYTDLPKEDEFTQRYKEAVQHWVVTKGMTDDEIVQKIKTDGIDILVDVSGHTTENRLLVFARKPAPVSLHWLEFGYTTGLTAIDYYLCDRATIPLGTEHLFSEKPWYLDGVSYAYRPSPHMGDVGELPAIRNGYITFGTLTRSIRLNHKVLSVWSALLDSVPNSRLLIDSSDFKDPLAKEELALRFAEYGIAPDRLEIGFHSPAWDILRKIDIGLDCFPHNSGTTLFETLYMGIPYITLAGRPSVGRLGASILNGLGRDEWIANSEEEYIQKLMRLADNHEFLQELRKNLRNEMIASPLMDELGFARSVEKAYKDMWQIYCEDKG